MRLQFYVQTKEISKNNQLYGVMTMIDDKPFDYLIGNMEGDKEYVIDKVSKNILIKNKTVLKNNYYSFKYDNLDITKKMLYKFHTEDFYKQYSKEQQTSLDALPAIFLSDLTKLYNLTKRMNNYEQLLQNKFYNSKNRI